MGYLCIIKSVLRNPPTKFIPHRIHHHLQSIMVDVLRYQIFLACLVLFLQLWYTAVANIGHIKSYLHLDVEAVDDTDNNVAVVIIDMIVRYLPLWAIMALGMYALGSVLLRVYTMADRPDAALEMTNEIEVAKDKLRSAGFVF